MLGITSNCKLVNRPITDCLKIEPTEIEPTEILRSRIMNQSNDITLTIVAGSDAGRTVRLPEGNSLVVGRRKSVDFRVSDPWMSREHFRIEHDGQNWTLTDLDSRQGTLVNDEKSMKRLLQKDDIIYAGTTSFCVSFGDDVPKLVESPHQKSAGLRYLLRSLKGVSTERTLSDSNY